MELSWKLKRYSRCYSCYEEQFCDVDGRPLYSLMPSMQQASQNVVMSQSTASVANSGTWTSFTSNESVCLSVRIIVLSAENALLAVSASTSDENYLIENINYPEAFNKDIKVSPKSTSLGVRYLKRKIIFDDEFSCRLCYDSMARYGFLTSAWTFQVRFDNGMVWRKDVESTPFTTEAINESPILIVPEQASLLPVQEVTTTPTEAPHNREPDSDETTLEGHSQSAIERITQNTSNFNRDIVILSSVPDEMQILESQERARMIILEAQPEEIEEIRASLQRNTLVEEGGGLEDNDFSFLCPESLQFHH